MNELPLSECLKKLDHDSLLTQAIGVGAVMAYSLVVTAALLWLVNFAMGLRVDEQSEQTGLDIAQHREHLGS